MPRQCMAPRMRLEGTPRCERDATVEIVWRDKVYTCYCASHAAAIVRTDRDNIQEIMVNRCR